MTKKSTLTELLIRNIPIPSVPSVQYPDTVIPGFGVRVSNKGLRTFYFRYRFGPKYGRIILGHFPDMKLAEARTSAQKARLLVLEGKDPNPRPIAVSSEGADATTNDTEEPKSQTLFPQALDDYFSIYCAANVRPSTAREYRWSLNAHFLPRWKNRTMESITKGDVLTIVNSIVKEGNFSAARHAQKYIKGFFNWATGNDYIAASPCVGLPPPPKPKKRKRVLTDMEIRQIWNAAVTEGFPYGHIARLALLTAQRRGEVASMEWTEIDMTKALWTIPPQKAKNDDANVVPLSPLAIRILREIKTNVLLAGSGSNRNYRLPQLKPFELPTPSPYVFASKKDPNKHFNGFSKAKKRLTEYSKVEAWVVHDLRRTVTTGLGSFDVPREIQKRILNHAQNDVTDIYDQNRYIEQRRKALERWSQHVQNAIEHSDAPENQMSLGFL